jgi:hypothetical protein
MTLSHPELLRHFLFDFLIQIRETLFLLQFTSKG